MQDPLRAFLTGKRSAKRHTIELPVQISGPAVWVVGESIDISSNGVCLRVALADLFDDAGALTEESSFDLVRTALDEGVKLLFPFSSVVAEATPMRVALDPDREGWLQLGCRLTRDLSVLELARLGLNPAECGPENPMYGPPSKALPVQMNGGSKVRVSLFAVEDRSTRVFEGTVVAYGPQSLAISINDADDPHEVLRKIGCLELYFLALRDGEVVWDSRAMIAALPMLSGLSGKVELGLVATSAPCGSLTGLTFDRDTEKAVQGDTDHTRKKAAKSTARKKTAKRKASKKKRAKKRVRKRPAAKPAAPASSSAEVPAPQDLIVGPNAPIPVDASAPAKLAPERKPPTRSETERMEPVSTPGEREG